MPTGSQDRLHLLRLLRDPLILGQAGLLAERGHRLDQLIDLRTQKMLPIADLTPRGSLLMPHLHDVSAP